MKDAEALRQITAELLRELGRLEPLRSKLKNLVDKTQNAESCDGQQPEEHEWTRARDLVSMSGGTPCGAAIYRAWVLTTEDLP